MTGEDALRIARERLGVPFNEPELESSEHRPKPIDWSKYESKDHLLRSEDDGKDNSEPKETQILP